MFIKPLPWECATNVNWLRYGRIFATGALLGLLTAGVHHHRVADLNRRHRAEVLTAHDDAYTMGRVDGMAEAFDVVVDHRQTQAS